MKVNEDEYYVLPKKTKITLKKEQNQNNIQNYTEEETTVLEVNTNYIESKLWAWEKDKDFKFVLPPTIFDQKVIIENDENLRYYGNIIQYENPDIVGQKFTPEILEQIWEKGEFNLPSNDPKLPYTWKLSKFTVKGLQNVSLCFQKKEWKDII